MAPWPQALRRYGVLLLLSYGLPRAFFASGAWRSALPEDGRSATEVVRLQLTALQENNPETRRRRTGTPDDPKKCLIQDGARVSVQLPEKSG